MKKRSLIYIISIVGFTIIYFLIIYIYRDNISNEKSQIFNNIRNIFIVLGGFIASILAVWRATIADKNYENELMKLESNKEAVDNDRLKFITQQLNERYVKAIELLGSDSISVRIGAMHTLYQLGQEDTVYKNTLIEILTSYIRNVLLSKENLQAKENWISRLEDWKSNNQKEYSPLHFDKIFKSKPYLRLPEDIKTALSILNNSGFNDINLNYTNWSGFDFSELTFNRFENFYFKNSNFSDTKFSSDYEFVNCNLQNVNFNGAYIQVVQFKDVEKKQKSDVVLKKDIGLFSGTFTNSYLDYPVITKRLSRTIFHNVYFRAGIINSPKMNENFFPISNLIFKKCFIGQVSVNARIENWLFSQCYFEKTELVRNQIPIRFVFFEKIEAIMYTHLFSFLNDNNLPSDINDIDNQDLNIIFMDKQTYENSCSRLKDFNFGYLPVQKITGKFLTSYPVGFKSFYNEVDTRSPFYFGLIIKSKVT